MTTTSPKLSAEFIKAREDFATWYDAKSEEMQALIDEISDRTYFIIDEDEYDAFIELLDAYNITDASTFEDAFYGEHEGIGERVTGEFCEQLVDDCGYLANADIPDFIKNHIDYSQMWYSDVRYDFNNVEFRGNTYFFNNNY